MDIESLLKPEGESHTLQETSDQEIYEAVMAAIKVRENIDINGGDDIEDDSHSHIDPRPTYRDVLRAVSTICRYIEDLNDPIAWKMEALFMSFNMKIRSDESRNMRSTVITDFFHKA
ncbi:hypothetical protein GALMADRAFT_56230 [Galerina marginata CBS 339.88]|uniref:Uncharacterized protein n=1 Tax=Galerina marginata (strain CBS 339.88) TaxID=685588 RepID=A0A067TJH2_GALM3|nr:hypothetical protein GALMADRAFT_56230 [Galerina marginata CBS 339.88]